MLADIELRVFKRVLVKYCGRFLSWQVLVFLFVRIITTSGYA